MSIFDNEIKRWARQIKEVGMECHPHDWQGVNVKNKPEMMTHEIMGANMKVPIIVDSLSRLAEDIKPNLPWADDHFLERISGRPINPGLEWKNWPGASSAEKFLNEDGQFNHNYMERYWPKYAGKTPGGEFEGVDWSTTMPHQGIRDLPYGDLNSVIDTLKTSPETRQAILCLYHPTDMALGIGRKPCSMYYHFLRRKDHLHIFYTMRSADLYNHVRDDIYLTIRLLLWVLTRLKSHSYDQWGNVKPGLFHMYVDNLHVFHGDWHNLIRENK